MSEQVAVDDFDSETDRLEWRVIEAAVNWRTVYDADSRYVLDRAIDALIAAREKAERCNSAESGVASSIVGDPP